MLINSQGKCVVIVDPYSSGSLLASRFRARGWVPIALHLRPPVGKLAKSFVADDFDHSYVYEGDVEQMLRTLSAHDVALIVPGQEAGVELCDVLSERLGLKRNPIETSRARRDKFEMHERIAAAGLRAIRQIRSGNLAEIEAWVTAHGRWPVVVKPVDSGGTDGVKICADLEQVRATFADNIARVNLLGFTNHQVLAQEFISGVEYVVDAVSSHGRHHVASMTRYRKEIIDDGSPLYKEMTFFAPNDEVHVSIVDYTRKVLDVLGVEHGPSHTEIFVDEHGPVLVESGARLFGGLVPKFQERAARVSPLDLAIDAYVDEARFDTLTREPQRYDRELTVWMMTTPRGGRIVGQPGRELVAQLPSYNDAIWFSSVGDEVRRTTDIVSGVGLLVLIHEDRAQIERDMRTVMEWEREGRLLAFEAEATA